MKTPASLLLALALAGFASAAHAAVLVIDNFGFEQPGTGKIADFRNVAIPGWEGILNSGTTADSGVESRALVNRQGSYVGFIQPQSRFTAYNYFSGGYVAAAGDEITINFVASPSQNTSVAFTLSLIWDDPGVAGAANVIESKSLNTTATSGTLASISATFAPLANAGGFIGQPIGFALTNNNTGSVWLYMDNFTASVTPVPEPASYAGFAGLAAIGLLALRRRPRR